VPLTEEPKGQRTTVPGESGDAGRPEPLDHGQEAREFLLDQLRSIRDERDALTAELLRADQLRTQASDLLERAENERDGYHQRLLDANAMVAELRSRGLWRGLVAGGPGRRSPNAKPTEQPAPEVELHSPGPLFPTDVLDSGKPEDESPDVSSAFRSSFLLRLDQCVRLLKGLPNDASEIGNGLDEFVEAIGSSPEPAARLAWLALVVADGRYPSEADLLGATRLLERLGPTALAQEAERRAEFAKGGPLPNAAGLDVRIGAVFVDLTHTVIHDLHTGIQRVVREVCSRWLKDEEVVPVVWNHDGGGLRALAQSERHRVLNWRENLHEPGRSVSARNPREENGLLVVPWQCRIVIPELSIEPYRCEGYRSLVTAGVAEGFSFLSYDMIPLSSPETMPVGMAQAFADYLSNVRSADFVSVISETSAAEYRAFFSSTAASRGLTSPLISCHPLPADRFLLAPDVAIIESESLESELRLAGGPMVLVVGSHEPRKNHLAVLDAAEKLWKAGHWFFLVFIGGGAWRDDEFNQEVARLVDEGRPIHVLKRVSEERLAAAYRRARFTVFPSIVEGFGLPIVESLRFNTPVIASNYGAMEEAAAGGGAVLIDPRNTEQIMAAMDHLLRSDDAIHRLSDEAEQRQWADWETYSSAVWKFLVPRP
jgi:glycosyltransferase involved in cell wall biosynthesis